MDYTNLSLLAALGANVAVMLICVRQPPRSNRRMLISMAVTGAVVFIYRSATGDSLGIFNVIPIWAFFLPSVVPLRGSFSAAQKLFLVFLVLAISHLLQIGASFLATALAGYGTPHFEPLRFGLYLVSLAAYVTLFARYGRGFLERLFRSASPGTWRGYAAYAGAHFILLRWLYGLEIIPPESRYARYFFYLLPLFSTAGFVLLFVSMIRAREKAEADFNLATARQTLTGARSHYAHLTGALQQIRTLRHDHRQQLGALGVLLEQGDYHGMQALFQGEQIRLDNLEIIYCGNPVVNALLTHYAAQMRKNGIDFSASVQIDPDLPIDSYDLCVVIGNLLDNAAQAAGMLPESRRFVSVHALCDEIKLIVEVKNSFDGDIETDADGLPVSRKPGGGLGLRSIKAVCDLHNGVYQPTWTGDTYTAYAVLNLRA